MTLRTGLGKPNLDVSRNPKFASGYLVPRGGGGVVGLDLSICLCSGDGKLGFR